MRGLKTIFGQQIQLKWYHCLQRIKNVEYLLFVIDVFNVFIELLNESNRKPNRLWLNKEDNFIINMCKNGLKNAIKMASDDNKSYLPYLNKLVHQYNDTYHHSIEKNIINSNYSAMT